MMSSISVVCTCDRHRNGAETVYGDHTFSCETSGDPFGWHMWRSVCSCGSRSRWQYQSESVSYHAWLNHLARVGIKTR